jgi:hypothetical protein
VCLYLYPRNAARQRIGKNVTAATNIHATIEELLDSSFSVPSVSYERKSRRLIFHRTYCLSIDLFSDIPDSVLPITTNGRRMHGHIHAAFQARVTDSGARRPLNIHNIVTFLPKSRDRTLQCQDDHSSSSLPTSSVTLYVSMWGEAWPEFWLRHQLSSVPVLVI